MYISLENISSRDGFTGGGGGGGGGAGGGGRPPLALARGVAIFHDKAKKTK